MRKTVKAWAVIWEDEGKLHSAANSPNLRERTFKVFPRVVDATRYAISLQMVVPCTISFTLPTKGKTKRKRV